MTTTLQDLKPSAIKPNKANPPGRTDDVTELAASITAKGILEPLIVAPNGTGTTFVLLAGHRRLAAAKIAKLKTVPCIVREDLTDPAEQLEAMLVENLQRTDLTPIEEAEAYQQLLEFPGYTQKRITETTGRPAATVRSRLKLAKLPETARSKIQGGQISLADASVMAEFLDAPEVLARLEQAVGTHNFTYTVESERRRRKAVQQTERALAELRKTKVTIVTRDELGDLEDKAEEAYYSDDAGGGYRPGWVYVDAEGDIDDLRVEPATHTSCPGHAAVVDNGEVHFVCTSPDKHPELDEQQDDEGPPATPEQVAEREAAMARRIEEQRIGDELDVAASVRRAHLLSFARNTIVSQQVAGELLTDAITKTCESDHRARSVLGATLLPGDPSPSAASIRAALRGLTMPALAVLLDLAHNADHESALLRAEGWGPVEGRTNVYYQPHKTTAPWRAKLVDVYGYEFSQPERDLQPPPDVIDVNLPADDVEAEA